jgi:serine O-acetyltransferase
MATRGQSGLRRRLGTFAAVVREIRCDVAAARERDPAARGVSSLEILLNWPGVHALLAHRVSSTLHAARVPLIPRAMALATRAITNIEIHPAASIGRGLFIDHGTGVVVGETAQIGDNVTLYQGVTLGGTGFATGKRHPTVQDNVTIGSGAKLLGPITVGHGAKIGANSVVITDVPPNSTVVGNPGHVVRVDGRKPEGPDADWIHLPDPVAEAIRALSSRLEALERALAEREGRDEGGANGELEPPAEVRRLKPRRGPNPAGG